LVTVGGGCGAGAGAGGKVGVRYASLSNLSLCATTTDEWPISISNPALSSSGDPFGSQGFNEGQIRKMLKGVAGEPIVVKDIAPTTTHAKAE
jgi:hypothetical protein